MAYEPTSAQNSPYQVEVEEGRGYFWCACGKSQRQPLWDGAHKGTGVEPTRFKAETTGTVNLCGCKHTDDSPFCDGTHNML